ncbi:FusB/FusC family EF-G-binding protein [Bacillus sp. CGMCC 1.16541]|uniref:FusB/FusC family EF-G-binding protein n=1 Tax=Bacillus sp. CGMCC 1.16541 TaxID=2185143 RepID=UPI000D73D765|nr:FusB/FusC family EF-G-binding protein [Bacillus sp. CGMCC 1.16541]
MEPFIRSDQYNFIKEQAQILINAHSTVNEAHVLNALKAITIEKVENQFSALTDAQAPLIHTIMDITDRLEADKALEQLKSSVIPFQMIKSETLQKLFPKAKKLKLPSFPDLDLKETTFLGWDDKGSGRRYIVAPYKGKLTGLHGTFTKMNQKGMCTLCHKYEDLGMFLYEKKGKEPGTFTKRGNYICYDAQTCSSQVTSLEKIEEFVELLKK